MILEMIKGAVISYSIWYNSLMSKLNVGLIIILVILLLIAKQDRAEMSAVPKVKAVPTAIPTPTEVPVAMPVRFILPKIGVDAPIEAVGTDTNGTMALPLELTKVGWYQDGAKPGQRGNAVIAGHLDSATGAGAIFYNLGNLEPGDNMSVLAADGAYYTFVVTAKVVYPYDEVPIDTVFGKSDEKHLNLVTCTGIWNATLQTYSHRMIIFSTLEEAPKPRN